ncbi:MAG: MerR family transcriptional regulator [Bacteroidetes bacterium]|nr:MerR family transcriptional regulator [Bacteroidota bacterium]MCL5026312.1 MerR family transcriptional regulator [Chloroflexota bacterium]
MIEDERPCFVISIAARMAQMHEQTLRSYERLGLVIPSRSRGRIRLYSHRDVERLRQIRRLMDDLGVNLAGVEVIMNLTNRITELEAELRNTREEMEREIERLRRVLAIQPRIEAKQ